MIWQAAIGERNMLAAFKHDDFRMFIQPTQSCRRRRPARYTPDN
jgi:hypothetical protein